MAPHAPTSCGPGAALTALGEAIKDELRSQRLHGDLMDGRIMYMDNLEAPHQFAGKHNILRMTYIMGYYICNKWSVWVKKIQDQLL